MALNFSPAVTETKAGWQARAYLPVLGLIVAAHAIAFLTYEPGDLVVYVSHWYERVARLGFGAFSEPFSNYTPPYLYLLWAASLIGGDAPAIPMIKLVAVVGGAWFAFALFRFFQTMGVRDAGLAALASLLLPSILLNVSLLGQADTFWVAACVLALTAAIEGRLPQVAFWSGVAFAFKAQAIFFAPFVVHFFLVRRAPIWCWLIPAAVYAAAMLPAWLAGWHWWYLVNVYFRQALWQPENRIFISNSGSWWTIFGQFTPATAIRFFPLGYVLTLFATTIYLRSKPVSSPNGLLAMATLSATFVPFLLPGMHERFFILADVLAFCLAIVARTKPAIMAAVLIQIGSAAPVARWAFQLPHFEIAAPFFILAGMLLLIDMIRDERAQTDEHA